MKAKNFLLQYSRSDITEAYYKFFLLDRHDTIEAREKKREQAEKEAGLAYDEMKEAAESDDYDIRQTAWSWLLDSDLELIPEGHETEYAASLIKTFYHLIRKSEISTLAEKKEEEKKKKEKRKEKIAENRSVLAEAAEASAETNEFLEDLGTAALNLRIENEKRKEREDVFVQNSEKRKTESKKMENERIKMAFSDPDEEITAEAIENEEKTKTAIDSPIATEEATDLETEEKAKKEEDVSEAPEEIEAVPEFSEEPKKTEEDKEKAKKAGGKGKLKKKKERHKKTVAKRRKK